MARSPFNRWIGVDFAVINGAWLCILGALGLSLLGVYAIDLGVRDAAAEVGGAGRMGALSPIALKQLAFIGVGLLGALVVALPHHRHIRYAAWGLMAVTIGLLVFLLLPFVPAAIVTPRNGARAWIDLGPIDFQPAELAKIAYVLVMADYLRFRQNHRTWMGLIPPAVITFIPVALIMLQPDLGTAILFAPTIFAMLIASGAKLKHLSVVVLAAVLAAPAAYPMLKPHQKARIVGLIKMVQDPRHAADDINYQALTAQTLAGAGQVWGTPDARSRSLIRFNRLPERHNDMILAVILNRFGLVGGFALLGLYGLWFLGIYLTAAMCVDAFGRLVVIGFGAIMVAQTFVNLGMTLGILPIIGVTLPFVSYGGSSMLTVWVMTGLVFGVAIRRSKRFTRPSFEFDDRPYDPAQVSTVHRAAPGTRR